MAHLASRRESGLGMRGIVRLVEVGQVAANARRRRAHELATGMAGIAIQGGMCADQRESRELHVIELRAHPVVHGMALLARHRVYSQRDVINACGLGVDEVSLVARVASRRKALKLTNRRTLVARIAIDRGMRPDQREAIHVLIDLLNRNIPALDGVTLLAVGAHLCLVNVRVALAALRSDIREDGLGVALRAGNALVHSA